MGAEIALKLNGISKSFGALQANDSVSLEVRKGEIHGILGENGAGKSTLMNIVFGLYEPDEGEIELNGSVVEVASPREAMRLGIGMVHQHFMLVPDMTVAENLAMESALLPRSSQLDEVAEQIRELSTRFGLKVDPSTPVEDLSIGDQQKVEIAKILYRGADLVILDEPSAALSPPEWDDLARFLKSLVAEGKSVILITHKLHELFGVADRCTVLRDGKVIATETIANSTKESLARMMVGRDVSLTAPYLPVPNAGVVLEVEGFIAGPDGERSDETLAVHAGEILGIAGVTGNGQQELVEAIVGLRDDPTLDVRIDAESLSGGPTAFTRMGGAVIPENRHRDAISAELSIEDNLMLKELDSDRFTRHGVINQESVRDHCLELLERFEIKAQDSRMAVARLSGGNQQKVVLARELSRAPRVIVAAQPTRGLDVGAMEFVYDQLNHQKAAGSAIVFISSELDEIMALSDRVAVMYEGLIIALLDRAEATLDRVGLLMAGERGVLS